MPIAREIINMFEFSRNSKIAISVDNHFDEYTPSQGKSVPTDRQTVLMHRYVVIESHRKTSVALWVHPFTSLLGWGRMSVQALLFNHTIGLTILHIALFVS